MKPAEGHAGPVILLGKSTTLEMRDVNFVGFKHAAVYADDVAGVDMTLDGCRMSGTTGDYASIEISLNGGGNITVTNSLFENNNVHYSGGAAYLITVQNVVINRCTFRNNTASEDGGALYVNGGKVIIADSVFTFNQAGNGGGAIGLDYIDDGSIIKSSNITDNAAIYGGGIYYEDDGADGDLTIEDDVIIKGNTADEGGDGIVCGGSVKPALSSGGFDDEIGTDCL